jgi:hypothetical protein
MKNFPLIGQMPEFTVDYLTLLKKHYEGFIKGVEEGTTLNKLPTSTASMSFIRTECVSEPINTVCHAKLVFDGKHNPLEHLHPVMIQGAHDIPSKDRVKLTTPYYDWLINHSPCREIILQDDPEWVSKFGMTIRTDCPVELVKLAAIMFRLPTERYFSFLCYNAFVEAGMKEEFAVAIQMYFHKDGGGMHFRENTANSNHDMFNPYELKISELLGMLSYKDRSYSKAMKTKLFGKKHLGRPLFGMFLGGGPGDKLVKVVIKDIVYQLSNSEKNENLYKNPFKLSYNKFVGGNNKPSFLKEESVNAFVELFTKEVHKHA